MPINEAAVSNSPAVTIVIVPRDRFSSVEACTRSLLENTREAVKLVFLDFGYSRRTVASLCELCAGHPFEIVPCGRSIPMDAFRDYLARIDTRYTCWVDNDTFVTPGWLTAMLHAAETRGMRAILPLTFEREGLDIDARRLELRVHISHSELRKTTVNGEDYIFDYKPFRRAAREEVPSGPWTVDFFELHTFFAETALLHQLDFPPMVVREHIDIGIQLQRLGVPIWCVPQAEVIFDNIHTRPTIEDLRFFTFRWSDRLVDRSHRLFAERWGWRFYNEQFLKNWAFRRRVFSSARFCGLPHRAADLISRAMVKFFRPALPVALRADPVAQSVRVFPDSSASSAAVPAS
ncbi:MAG TPA: glycosyltransferase [Gemmatimonadales bacterium]